MAIEVISKPKKAKKLRGTCQDCKTKIRCDLGDTKELIDRDTQPGMATRYIKCPECRNAYLWVR
ncbi:MAG: hypothetical protein ACOYB3_01270 [Azonexus sp.]